MRLAFCLFKYFPFGGLQRDFLRIAKVCVARGHVVDVYTMQWDGECEPDLAIRTIRTSGWRNHTQRQDFIRQVEPYLTQGYYDLVVGFNKMPGLDVYYAADTCYQAKARKQHGWLYRLTKRYRSAVADEQAVFSPVGTTEILLLSPAQQSEFMHYYQTPPERFHLLPPGIDKDRIAPTNAAKIRASLRKEWDIKEDDYLLLAVGSGFKTKGLDRTLIAYAALPSAIKAKTRLFVIGKDTALPFEKQAMTLGIDHAIEFLGGRNDVPQFLLGADLLMHPAYNENTGTVLLEALASGLPVLTTDVCGYANYVSDAKAGMVLSSPFKQEEMNRALVDMLLSSERSSWQKNAIFYAKRADIYSLPEKAVDLIERLGDV